MREIFTIGNVVITLRLNKSLRHDYNYDSDPSKQNNPYAQSIILTKNPHPILHRRGSLVAVLGVVEWLMVWVYLNVMVVVDVSENFDLWRIMNSLSRYREVFSRGGVCASVARVDRGFEEK